MTKKHNYVEPGTSLLYKLHLCQVTTPIHNILKVVSFETLDLSNIGNLNSINSHIERYLLTCNSSLQGF